MTDGTDDAALVALIDGKLEEAERNALTARLEKDPELLRRLEQLMDGGAPFGPAFAALLNEAPVARMQANLDRLATAEALQPARRARWIGLAAAAAAVFFLGWAVGRFAPLGPVAPGSDRYEWRAAVADYVSLYSVETFATASGGPEAALAVLSGRLGISLNPGSIVLPDMTFKRAFMLSYDGAPLGQIAYVDEAGRPAAFCIIRNGEKDAAVTTDNREGLSLASWARDGRGYVLVGHFPTERAATLANTLASRF